MSKRRLALQLNPTLQLTAVADVSRRGRGRARIGVEDPVAVGWLLETLMRGRPSRALPIHVERQLITDGILVHARDIPRDVNLEPRMIGGAQRRSDTADLEWASGHRIVHGPTLPPDVARATRNPEPFLPDAPILWVRDATTGLSWPYRVSQGDLESLKRLAPQRKPERLPRRLHAGLVEVGALESRSAAAARRRRWVRLAQRSRRHLRECGFAVISGLIPPAVALALQAYYAALEREGYLYGGESRRVGLPLLHGEPVLEFLTGQLAATVAAITGESAPPTFTPYLRVYDPGATLERHRDRPVCRWNVDLVVGGSPAPTRRMAWPLWFERGGRRRSVRLGLGEAVVYRGVAVEHWRNRQPAGRTTAVASLHYGDPPETTER